MEIGEATAELATMSSMEMKARPAEQRGPAGLAMEIGAPQTAPRPREQCDGETGMLVLYLIMALFMFGLVLPIAWADFTYKEPEYSVAIATVSGLDPATDRSVLNPEFNLTVRIAVRSSLLQPCDESYTTVKVSYHGFTLASASAPQVCNIAEESQEGRTVVRTVVARGTRVWLPGPALDSLAADVRRAAGVFDVTLTIPGHTGHDDDGLVVSSVGRPIGDDGGSALCDVRVGCT